MFLNTLTVLAQTNAGSVRGLVRDSVHNFVMPAATVSIYKVETGELVSYQLSDNFGRVIFKGLPMGIPLRVIATNVGYAAVKKEFTISPKTGELDVKTLNMYRVVVSLKEVAISGTPPPVQMRGDTLEFNADAFKLDSNAVVDDMLKKLPGVTVWNDGVITVNGKRINKLLVEGKEFFDNSGKIALLNLSKNSVNKIQVYEDKSNPDPIETKTNMNIVLKNGKKDGYFGKVGASLGTTKRYDGNGMISYFSPRDQISVVGAINNVNKTADNTNTLFQINSFKGEGISNDYHSDFAKPGSLVFKAAGFTALHDFGKKKDNKIDTNKLKVEYFMTANSAVVNEYLNTAILVGLNGHLTQTAISTLTSSDDAQAFHAEYEKKFDHNRLYASYDLLHKSFSSYSTRNITSTGDSVAEQSQSKDQQDYKDVTTSQTAKINFESERYKDLGTNRNRSVDVELGYWFNLNNANEERNRVNEFRVADTSQSRHFNRHYLTETTASTHNISNNFNNILGLFQKRAPRLRIDVKNLLTYYETKQTDVVSDLFDSNNHYVPNTYLSNHIDTKILDYKPGLSLSKSIINKLSDRYRKIWSFIFFAQTQLYKFENLAQQRIQNLNRSYFYFIPSANIAYNNNQLGRFREYYSLKYNTRVTYPSLQQLAPLVDDANVFFLSYGNVDLKPSYAHDLSFAYNYNNTEAKNPFRGELRGGIGLTDNFISDSSYFDELGRSSSYPINVSGEHHAGMESSIQKAFKYYAHQFQVSEKSKFNYSQSESSLNGRFYETKGYSWSINADLTYTYKDLVAQIGETFFNSKNSRPSISDYRYSNWKTYANVSLNIPQGLFFSSRIDFNKSIASNTNNIYFTIWNIDVGYRFLKGNNCEVKISGLDLLHENKNVFNNISNNSITTGTVNVLQQYFMLTLAYYPRKFGLSKRITN